MRVVSRGWLVTQSSAGKLGQRTPCKLNRCNLISSIRASVHTNVPPTSTNSNLFVAMARPSVSGTAPSPDHLETIHVKFISPSSGVPVDLSCRVSPATTVDELKLMIQDKLDGSPALGKMKLIYRGKILGSALTLKDTLIGLHVSNRCQSLVRSLTVVKGTGKSYSPSCHQPSGLAGCIPRPGPRAFE